MRKRAVLRKRYGRALSGFHPGQRVRVKATCVHTSYRGAVGKITGYLPWDKFDVRLYPNGALAVIDGSDLEHVGRQA